jgi:hypothetical protein
VTERTIRSHAKALAGAFYDSHSRTERFRNGEDMVPVKVTMTDPKTGLPVEVEKRFPFKDAYPNAHEYVKAWWPAFVDLARKQLTAMLGMPDEKVSPHMKKAIYDAIIEDREKQMRGKASGSQLVLPR